MSPTLPRISAWNAIPERVGTASRGWSLPKVTESGEWKSCGRDRRRPSVLERDHREGDRFDWLSVKQNLNTARADRGASGTVMGPSLVTLNASSFARLLQAGRRAARRESLQSQGSRPQRDREACPRVVLTKWPSEDLAPQRDDVDSNPRETST